MTKTADDDDDDDDDDDEGFKLIIVRSFARLFVCSFVRSFVPSTTTITTMQGHSEDNEKLPFGRPVVVRSQCMSQVRVVHCCMMHT